MNKQINKRPIAKNFKNQKKKYSKMPTIHKNFQNMSNKIARFSTQKQAIIPTNLNIA